MNAKPPGGEGTGPLGILLIALLSAEVDKALRKMNVSRRPEILILDHITDLRDKYIFPLVNVLSFYQMASEADSWAGAGHRDLLTCPAPLGILIYICTAVLKVTGHTSPPLWGGLL
ncbi:hypothetical protein ACRRTK_023159 [Alexandromys fortis]